MINRITLIGRCGKDVYFGTTQKGTNYASVSVATGTNDNTVWFDVIAFEKSAEWLAKASKGTLVYVEGPVSLSQYQAKDGTQRAELKVNAYVVRLLEKTEHAEAFNQSPATPATTFEEVPF